MKLDIKDEAFQKAKDFIAKGGELSSIRAKYELTAAALKELQNI
jgi:hypothetical protein